MKKFFVVLFVVLSLSLMSCPSPVVEKEEPFTFQGHWNILDYQLRYIERDMYFEGDQWWMLKKDKMTSGGRFTYTDTDLSMWIGNTYHGTQRYEIIDKDTIFVYPPHDGMSYLSNIRLKGTGRTGKMLPVNRHWTFVDD